MADQRLSLVPERMFVYRAPMDADADQRVTLGELLDRHPRLVPIDQLRDGLRDVEIDQALAALIEDGLATRLGDMVGASRAAVRADPLRL